MQPPPGIRPFGFADGPVQVPATASNSDAPQPQALPDPLASLASLCSELTGVVPSCDPPSEHEASSECSDVDLDAGIRDAFPGAAAMEPMAGDSSGSDADLDAAVAFRPPANPDNDAPAAPRPPTDAENRQDPMSRLFSKPQETEDTVPLERRYNALTQVWNQEISPTLGTNVRFSNQQKMESAAGKSNPITRTFMSLERLAFLKSEHSDYSSSRAAQALFWKAAESGAIQGVKTVFEALRSRYAAGSPSWVCISRRLDESSMFLKLSADESAVWITWILAALKADRFLNVTDIQDCYFIGIHT